MDLLCSAAGPERVNLNSPGTGGSLAAGPSSAALGLEAVTLTRWRKSLSAMFWVAVRAPTV
jgi:hypothetical protein